MQVEAGGDVSRSELADSQITDQVGRYSYRHSGTRISRCFEQQIAHALIAQGDTGVHCVQVDGQCRHARAIDVATESGEVMHFQVVGIFGGGEVEVRVSGV